LASRGLLAGPDEIVIAGTGMAGFDLCLDTLVDRGDTVILDTPSYLPIIFSLKRKELRVLEIYSHPLHGVDPDQLAHLLDNFRVKAVILSLVNHFPTGVTLATHGMERLSRIMDSRKVPLIELDMFSDLTYQDPIPAPLMAYGSGRRRYLIGSLLHTVGPDFGLSWVVCRDAKTDLIERKFLNNLLYGDGVLQLAIAEYMSERQYDRDLRRLRRQFAARSDNGFRLLRLMLPHQFSASRPTGGYMCWVRGPSSFDATQIARAAHRLGLSLTPGQMFSPSDGFHNFLAVNLSAPWMEREPAAQKAIAALFYNSRAIKGDQK
jgi:DNA-binding transcriptional MocR family regulator